MQKEHHLTGFLCHALLGAVQLEEDIFKDLCILTYVHMFVPVYAMRAQVPMEATGCFDPLEQDLKSVVSFLMWVVGTELRSPRRADHDLNC